MTKTIETQRNALLNLLPDQIYGVYKLDEQTKDSYSISLIPNILTTYQNVFEENKDNIDIGEMTIIELGSFRKGKINILAGNFDYKDIDNLILLSSGVIEYINRDNGIHLFTTLRDGGGFDSLQFTTTAGRCISEDLVYEVEREHFEEGPFLGKTTSGEYCLAIPDGDPKGKEYTRESIEHFLHYKYTLNRDEVLEEVFLELFEIVFPGVGYDNLGDILKDISEHERFVYYSWEKGNIPEINDDIKKIHIGGKTYEYYVFYDKDNNTIEFRDIRRIISFPDDFAPLDPTRPGKLFLESRYQFPREPHIEMADRFGVPTISRIAMTIKNKKANLK